MGNLPRLIMSKIAKPIDSNEYVIWKYGITRRIVKLRVERNYLL